jgi:amidase
VDSADLAFAGMAQQAELVRDGEVKPRELVELYLERIHRLEPQLNSFRVVLAERALAEADQAEARRGAGEERPLLGVPVAIKDNVDLAGEVTAHGSRAHGGPVTEDAEVVRRLRAAGAVIVGKANMSELAIWPATETITFGATRNPWDTDRSPGGSSGGSASAVAAGLVPAAYASDGGGSIRIPAACCGLFGLKPQRGRVSLKPLREHWQGLSAVGCVTRSVLDTALWLDVVRGPAEGDADVAPEPPRAFVEAARATPRRLRIARSLRGTAPLRLDDDVRRAVDETADLLRGLGHEVNDAEPDYGMVSDSFIPRWLRGIHDEAVALSHPERLERRNRRVVRAGGLLPEAVVARARRREADHAARIGEVFRDHDVLLSPTIPGHAWPVGLWECRGLASSMWRVSVQAVPYTTAWNVTGQPAASVPAGFTGDGLSLAVQLVGRPNEEDTLISLAAQIEAERPWAERRPPVT